MAESGMAKAIKGPNAGETDQLAGQKRWHGRRRKGIGKRDQ